jgi:hypothetical protein
MSGYVPSYDIIIKRMKKYLQSTVALGILSNDRIGCARSGMGQQRVTGRKLFKSIIIIHYI